MISKTSIQNLAIKFQTTELNVKREYMQHLFLSYFYQQPQAGQVFFKGGTALRLVFGSVRFSEDLDFSSGVIDLKPIEDAVVATLAETEKEGVKTEIMESKATSGGYLATMEFSWGSEVMTLELNFSGRIENTRGEVIAVVSDFIPSYPVTVLLQQELVREKLAALMSRQKPRDFFDLYFMLRKNMLLPEDKVRLNEVAKILNRVDINFEVELKQFLPKSHWPIIRDFKSVLEREISR